MFKRVISVFLVLVSLLSIIPLSAYAANNVEDVDIIWLKDGSYITVSMETSPARVANTVSGSNVFTCYNDYGTK